MTFRKRFPEFFESLVVIQKDRPFYSNPLFKHTSFSISVRAFLLLPRYFSRKSTDLFFTDLCSLKKFRFLFNYRDCRGLLCTVNMHHSDSTWKYALSCEQSRLAGTSRSIRYFLARTRSKSARRQRYRGSKWFIRQKNQDNDWQSRARFPIAWNTRTDISSREIRFQVRFNRHCGFIAVSGEHGAPFTIDSLFYTNKAFLSHVVRTLSSSFPFFLRSASEITNRNEKITMKKR